MKLKDLKITYNTLTELEHPVPKELIVHIASLIREVEGRNLERKLNRMSEEELIALESRQRRTLRINTPDGRIIQKKVNEATFRTAMAELDAENVSALGLTIGRKPLVVFDATMKRQRIKGYAFLKPGFFVISKSTAEEKFRALNDIDTALELDWDIDLV